MQRGSGRTRGKRERERQESPYIAHRKSCVREGSSFFGHGGFLAGWKTDISSTGLLLERGSDEGWRGAAGVVVGEVVGQQSTGLGSPVSAAALPFALSARLSSLCSACCSL